MQKKTLGKTTTIVEMLKGKSSLVSELLLERSTNPLMFGLGMAELQPQRT
nr:hypothetical protein [Methanosarcina barkeri]